MIAFKENFVQAQGAYTEMVVCLASLAAACLVISQHVFPHFPDKRAVGHLLFPAVPRN